MGERWAAITDELRRVVVAGKNPGDVDPILHRIERIFECVEKAGALVDADLGWAVLGLICVQLRREKRRRPTVAGPEKRIAAR